MAKRPPSRSQADDSAAAAPPKPRVRRSRGTPGAPEAAEVDTQAARREAEEESLSDEDVGPSTSMASEPSEEDIRLRAYHRYLERGGAPGSDFDDWLEAERELRSRKS
jgi:hypothetical protein